MESGAKAFASGHFDERLAETLVVLIPKVDVPQRLAQFQPISLCNVTYKLITKVLVNRLRLFLVDIVGPLQNSFILGRGTTNNMVIAQEILHHMYKSKSKKGTMALKIDLHKAYDIIEWSFLNRTLLDFAFLE